MTHHNEQGQMMDEEAPPVSFATWDPLNKSAVISLSGGNLIASANSTAWKSVMGTFSKSTGKPIWDHVTDSASHYVFGVGTSSANVNSFAGSNAESWGYNPFSGLVFHGGSVIDTIATIAVGRRINFRWDVLAGNLWISDQGIDLNGGSPVLIGLPTDLLIMSSIFSIGTSATLNAGQSSFPDGIPAGFDSGFFQ